MKKKDGDAEKDKGKKCKCCGKDKGSGEGGGKKDGGGNKTNKDGGADKAKTDGGDGEKKCGQPKEKSDNSGGGDDKGGGHSGWTEAQDSKIKEMKDAGKSWKEIALEVGASKNDVTKRFKELNKTGDEKSGDSGRRSQSSGWDNRGTAANSGDQRNARNNGGGGDSGTQSNGWENGGRAAADPSGQSNGWDTGGGAENFSGGGQSNGWDKGSAADASIGIDFGADLFDEPAKEPETLNDTATGGWGNVLTQDPPKPNDDTTNNWNDGGKKQKGKKDKGYWNVDSGDQNTGGSRWDNGTGNSTQSPNQANDGGGWDKYDSNHSSKPQEQHSGGMGRLQPNEIWSREDCEVLEMLAHRYKEYKWLHIKAGFFNWTGRMISDEMIQQKFQYDGLT